MKPCLESPLPFWFTALVLAAWPSAHVCANPTGLTIASGSASLQTSGPRLDITTSPAAVLNWQSFNIGAGETTAFHQPDAHSVVLNLIGGASPSQIFGQLTANGTVILANGSGFYFGPNSFVSVGGSFIATTAPAPEHPDSASWRFTGLPPLARIVNYGQIQSGSGQSLYLIAEHLDNYGELDAPGGTVDLAAGQTVLLSEAPDGRGLTEKVTLPAGSVDNFGRLVADGGRIAAQAQVINQDGLLQADSVRTVNGQIELVASDQVNLGANSRITARGDDSTVGSAGGTVVIKSGATFSDAPGSTILTTGSSAGGAGGNVEISAPNLASLNTAIHADGGGTGPAGTFLLDPQNLILWSSANGSAPVGATTATGGSVSATGASGFVAVDVNTAFANITGNITLAASGNIYLGNGKVSGQNFAFLSSPGITWNLSQSTGGRDTSGLLTLQAGGDILFGQGSVLQDQNSWSVSLQAGYNAATHAVTAGTGNLYLNTTDHGNNNGTISTAAGNITLVAGQNLEVGSGTVYTSAGGNIFAEAESGVLYTGLIPARNLSSTAGIAPSVPGAFSTLAGGNVTLLAGTSVSPAGVTLNSDGSYTGTVPTSNGNQNRWPGETAAYGPGDLTVISGGQIFGNFLTTDGTGTLLAGTPVADLSSAQLLTLQTHGSGFSPLLASLASELQANPQPDAVIGGASTPILLSESVGTWNVYSAHDLYLNEIDNPSGTFNRGYNFTYAASTPNDPVADSGANLWAANAIDLQGGADAQAVPRSGFPDMLSIYPPQLSLNAGAGGITLENSLVLFPSTRQSLQLTTRDGGSLIGLNNASLTVSDSSATAYSRNNNFTLNPASTTYATTPLASQNPNGPVQINLTGDWNSLELDLPLAATINVLGNLLNPNLQVWNLHARDQTTINVGAAAQTALENAGLLDPATQPALKPGGDVNLYGAQWQLFGPGQFTLNCATLELDHSAAIAAKESLFPVGDALYGSTLTVTTTGNMSLTTTTSLVNYGLDGNLLVNVGLGQGGTLNLGGLASDADSENSPTAGIFTSSGGNVVVQAGGDISLGTSRIATFDGGNVTVLSQNGNINCGQGDLGVTYVDYAYELDPVGNTLVDLLAGLGPNLSSGLGFGIPGSGIRANTFVDGSAHLGNLLIETPNGSINAAAGGIVAVHFNSLDLSQAAHSQLDLFAGYELLNLQNQPLTASDLSSTTLQSLTVPTGTPDPYASSQLVNANGQVIGRLVRVSEENLSAQPPILRDVTSSDSGIIGQSITAEATGQISGLFAGRDVSVNAPQLGQVVVFSHDPPVITGDSLPGTQAVIVTPTVDTAAAPAAAPTATAPTADTANTAANKTQGDSDNPLDADEKKRRKTGGIGLAQKVSRVTVLLPTR